MRKVVYFLGAGFSAPLGLPVMSNFLWKAKDLYFADKKKHRYFARVFDEIERLSYIKNYFVSDLLNIEEIFSILEMERSVNGKRAAKQFTDLICDTIDAYTPVPRMNTSGSANLHRIWEDKIHRLYGTFVASLLRLRVTVVKATDYGQIRHVLVVDRPPQNVAQEVQYSVVTLNYDTVLESFQDSLLEKSRSDPQSLATLTIPEQGAGPAGQGQGFVWLCKLHGSVDAREIVPPTWNKRVSKSLRKSWEIALEVLREATDLRIIGYSLPGSDAYIRYLLKAAVRSSENLQRIDALVLDPDESVRRRFDSFVAFRDFRFKNADVLDYLRQLYEKTLPRLLSGDTIVFQFLEDVHEGFFSNH